MFVCICKKEKLTKNLLTTSRYYANQHLNDKLVGKSVLSVNWLSLQSSIDFCCVSTHTRFHIYKNTGWNHAQHNVAQHRANMTWVRKESTFWYVNSFVDIFVETPALVRNTNYIRGDVEKKVPTKACYTMWLFFGG